MILAQNMKNNKTYLHTLIMLSLGLEKSCIIDKQTQNSLKRMQIPEDIKDIVIYDMNYA